MQTWQIGDIRITRIEELAGPLFDPVMFFPDYEPSMFEKHKDWIYPGHVDKASGRLIASIHSWLVETPHHRILIDSCVGNDKDRMPFRDWHQMNTPWLENLRAAGVRPEDIDFVMCTHLHVDHVGWNTCLKNGVWVPTFPNARYVFSRTEFEFREAERKKDNAEDFNEINRKTFDDSVLPIMDLAQLIEGETEIIDDILHIYPAPGHTPGSITIDLARGSALFTGDILHHPIQVYEPHWNSAFCEMPDEARATRLDVLQRCEREESLMMPAHFGPAFAGRVRAHDNHFSFDFGISKRRKNF
ncbi:MAG: MBL fold metallo-hydrolase [Pseudomonadales bacterium]|nr:MBL fold metallo-hydrolase [Pseudomonadales bacterium]